MTRLKAIQSRLADYCHPPVWNFEKPFLIHHYICNIWPSKVEHQTLLLRGVAHFNERKWPKNNDCPPTVKYWKVVMIIGKPTLWGLSTDHNAYCCFLLWKKELIIHEGTGSTRGHKFYMGTQNESNLEIWWRRLLILASNSNLKFSHMFVQGSHAL